MKRAGTEEGRAWSGAYPSEPSLSVFRSSTQPLDTEGKPMKSFPPSRSRSQFCYPDFVAPRISKGTGLIFVDRESETASGGPMWNLLWVFEFA